MGNSPRSFGQQQTAVRGRDKGPSPATFLGQCRKIGEWIETEYGQLEAVLPLCLAVTARGVASVFTENRQDVIFEMKCVRDRGLRNPDSHTLPLTFVLNFDSPSPIR